MKMSMPLTVLLLLLTATIPAYAKVLRVTPQTAGGLPAALAADPDVQEVVFAAGTYHSSVNIPPLKDVDPVKHPLLLRAEDGAEVVFDGSDPSAPLDAARPVEGHPGVFAVAYQLVGHESPKLWELGRRVRYQQVADARSVARYPASYATADGQLYFHTVDSRPPQPGQVTINHAHMDYGLFITRPHVTVRGMTFRNYLTRAKWSTGVQLRGDHITVEDCTASNCSMGFTIVGHNNTLRNCRADDCGSGVYVGGNDATVADCRFFKQRDAFMVPMYEQDDSGIQYYHPATNGTLRGNVAQGFARGITLKCEGIFLVEHNTIVDCHEGILRTVPQVGDRYVRNLIVGCSAPGLGGGTLRLGVVNDRNIFWDMGNVDQAMRVLVAARAAGSGGHNLIADPRFANRAEGDFRVAPGSVCIGASDTARPVGALGAVPDDFADRQPPAVRVKLAPPAFPAGVVAQVVFERDPWIGGGNTFIEERLEPDDQAEYETAESTATMEIEARDAMGKPALMRHRVNDGPWSEPEPYVRRKSLSLPATEGVHALALCVSDDAGNWSEPHTIRVRLARAAPSLVGEPAVHANDHGVVLSFRSTTPAFARVEFSEDQSFASHAQPPQRIHRRWNSNDGGDWVTRWREPRTVHHLALIVPRVKPATRYHYRIVLEDAVGRRTQGPVGTFTVAGKPRTWTVSAAGVDDDSRGTPHAPVATLQFAVDRALPGDRVQLMEGVYPGDTLLTHGGAADAPITIEAHTPGSVVLDSARRALSLLRLDKADHVLIRNLELRGYGQDGSAVYVADSRHVTIEGCRVWNGLRGEGWPYGRGIFAHRSPGLTVRQCVTYKQEHGIYLLVSPQATIIRNTVVANLYAGLCMHFSSKDTMILNNSFTYNQSDQMLVEDTDTAAFDAMVIDHNNLAARIEPFAEQPGEVISGVVPDDPALRRGDASKAIVWMQGKRYRDFATWQQAHGKDTHSIFVDPKYVDATRGNFHLLPGSPNIGAGKDGATIGAMDANARVRQ